MYNLIFKWVTHTLHRRHIFRRIRIKKGLWISSQNSISFRDFLPKATVHKVCDQRDLIRTMLYSTREGGHALTSAKPHINYNLYALSITEFVHFSVFPSVQLRFRLSQCDRSSHSGCALVVWIKPKKETHGTSIWSHVTICKLFVHWIRRNLK